jgi:hypothetical protein
VLCASLLTRNGAARSCVGKHLIERLLLLLSYRDADRCECLRNNGYFVFYSSIWFVESGSVLPSARGAIHA